MKHKILLPTDFSDNSWNAIKYAVQLFKKKACTFYLLNVYTPLLYNLEYIASGQTIYDLDDSSKKNSETQLDELKKRISKEFENPLHQIETISAFNELIPGIKSVVDSEEIDYIIMGTKGATGAKEILFGSNTIHTLKNATCPLLAIPENFEFKKVQNMLFPTDFHIMYDPSQINPILEIVNMDEAEINVLHVSSGYELTETQKFHKAILDLQLNKVNSKYHDVPDADLEEAINEFQKAHQTDMLVMISNKHSFFENILFRSTIRQIGFHLKIPFLVIPTKKNKN